MVDAIDDPREHLQMHVDVIGPEKRHLVQNETVMQDFRQR